MYVDSPDGLTCEREVRDSDNAADATCMHTLVQITAARVASLQGVLSGEAALMSTHSRLWCVCRPSVGAANHRWSAC